MTTMTTDQDFAVTQFDEFVGQATIRERIDLAARSAHARGTRMDHVLLDGPPGSGKSTMATLIAARMDEPLMVIGQAITARELAGVLYELDEGVLFLDEIHVNSDATQNAMLPLLEGGSFAGWEFPRITVVAATTEPRELLPPLLDRFMVLRYVPYTDDEMAAIVARFARCAHVDLDEATCRAFAVASAGGPRAARELVRTARDYALDAPPTIDQVLRACRREPDGLSYDHLDYLEVLSANQGRAGLKVLATRLRMHAAVVEDLERILLDRRLVRLETSGRVITAAGRERIARRG
jgi:Holliday junction DNA helicase RuvB